MELIRVRTKEVDTSDPDRCWEWPGGRARGGYGIVGGSRSRRIPPFRVARVVLAEKLGRPLYPGMRALHECDNPPCFNPRHLVEGTQKKNLRDASARRRTAIGERNGNARLSNDDVREIRVSGESPAVLGDRFGVTAEQVRKIRRGDRWALVS